MKLTYRGIPYEASSTSEATAQTSHQVPHQPASPKLSLRSAGQELTYRGVRYTA